MGSADKGHVQPALSLNPSQVKLTYRGTCRTFGVLQSRQPPRSSHSLGAGLAVPVSLGLLPAP